MKPFVLDWTAFLLPVLPALALLVVLLVLALKLEKKEKVADDPVASKKLRYTKYGVMAAMIPVMAAPAVLIPVMIDGQEQGWKDSLASHVEQQELQFVSGFESNLPPLEAGQEALFIVSTTNGDVRCNAAAGATPEEDITFMCQDPDSRDFTIPMNELKDHELPAAKK